MVKLKRIITSSKGPRKKIEIKTMRTKLKNIIPSIWNEWWNWKFWKNFYEKIKKKIRNLKNENHIGEYNIW